MFNVHAKCGYQLALSLGAKLCKRGIFQEFFGHALVPGKER